MTTATSALLRAQKNIKETIALAELPEVNWKKICFAGFFVSAILLIFYVWQINELTRGYYLVNNYQNQIEALSEENKNLQVAFAESSFLGQALGKIKALNFQKTTLVKYVQVSDTALAKAN